MRKVLLLMICMGLIMPVMAQEQLPALRWMVGGSSSLSGFLASDHYKDDNGTSAITGNSKGFSFAPKAGYFVFPRTVVGLDVPLNYTKIVTISAIDGTQTSEVTFNFIASPFIRKYFGDKPVRPFAEAEMGVGLNWDRTYDVNNAMNTNVYRQSLLSFRAGASASFNKWISADLSLGYSSTTLVQLNDNPTTQRSIHGSFGLNLGVSVFLESFRRAKAAN